MQGTTRKDGQLVQGAFKTDAAVLEAAEEAVAIVAAEADAEEANASTEEMAVAEAEAIKAVEDKHF